VYRGSGRRILPFRLTGPGDHPRKRCLTSTLPPRETGGVGKGILQYAPSRFFEPALGLLCIPILTRVLGKAGYGDFSVLVLTVGLVRTTAFDWINNCALRFHRPLEGQPGAYHSNLFLGLLLGVVCSSLLVYGAWGALPGSLGGTFEGMYVWLVLAATAEGFARNGEMTFRAMQRPGAFFAMRAALACARHVAGLACLWAFSRSLAAYVGGWGCTALVIAVGAWLSTGGLRHLSISAVSLRTLKDFARFGFPIAFVLLANSMQTIGIRYVLQYLSGSEATGLYSAAYNIGGSPVIVFQSIVMLGLYPLAIEVFEKEGRFDAVVRDGLRYFVLAAAPLLLLLGLLANPALHVLAGAEFAEAGPALAVISAGTFAYGLSQYFALRFLVCKQTSRMAVINLTGAVLNIALAMGLVPRYGYVAAAAATTAAYLLILVGAMVWGVRPGRSTIPFSSCLHCAVGSVPMIAVWYVVHCHLILPPFAECVVCTVGGGAAYVLTLWISRELDPELAAARRSLTVR